MNFIYDILIRFYHSGIAFASVYNSKAKKWIAGRKNWRTEFSSIPFHENKWVWFHCCSFGEFQDGKTLIDEFHGKYPGHKILLTFHSPSGYELLKNYVKADKVFYLPLDTKSNVRFFLDRLNPQAAFFIRNDVWPNYIHSLNKRKIRFALVSFTLSEKSRFLKFPQHSFYRSVFQKFNAILVQDKISKDILVADNFNANILITGNSRMDRVENIFHENFRIPEIEIFTSGNFTVIAGSALTKDRKIFLETYSALKNESIRWIIAPHEIHRNEIAEAEKFFGNELICFSEISRLNQDHKLLWVDHIGLLAKMYRYADLAFIGGGFDSSGIHNILEPAVFGCTICFGPNYRGLHEATDLLKREAEIINDVDELKKLILRYKTNKEYLKKTKTANSDYISENSGATKKFFDYLETNKFIN